MQNAFAHLLSLKHGDFVDFQSDSGKWHQSQVIEHQDNKIVFRWIIQSNSLFGKIEHETYATNIELRYFFRPGLNPRNRTRNQHI